MKLLITGSNGRLGNELRQVFPTALHTTRKELDFTDFVQCANFIGEHKPDVIIHAGAMTNVENCEINKEQAWKANVLGTANLIQAINFYCPQTFFLYISTPCVFSGTEEEIDERTYPHPISYYGITKMAGEIVTKRAKQWAIVRSNFIPYEEYPYDKAFTDRTSRYLFAHDFANAIKDFLQKPMKGVIHLVGQNEISMFDLAGLCPNDKKIEPYTLEEHYKINPDGAPLTKRMNLVSKRWEKAYPITKKGQEVEQTPKEEDHDKQEESEN